MKRFVVLAAAILMMAAGTVRAQTADAKKVEAGKAAFTAQKCIQCHAVKGVSTAKMAGALDGVGAKLSAADLKGWLTNTAAMEAKLKEKPKVPMSTFMKSHKLTDADVDSLVAYMQSLK